MGFMDKVKAAAQDVAKEAKKATSTAQEKIGAAQTRKKMNDKAQELGWVVYREKAQATPAPAEVDRLVGEISALEAELAAAEAADGAAEAPAADASPDGGEQTP